MSMNFIEGEILCFDKPLHWTSFRLVREVRRKLSRHLGVKKLKVGHAGTLDPLATGVMILCTGKKTKEIESIQADEKEYIATLKLGATTPSFDKETEEDNVYPTGHITQELINQAIPKFTGTLDQVPPLFSAVKVEGERAYSLARNGISIELKSKKIVIKEIEQLKYEFPYLTLRVVCGKGTYIRALARDIGESISSGAYLTSLQRTRIGNFKLDKCLDMDAFDELLSHAECGQEK